MRHHLRSIALALLLLPAAGAALAQDLAPGKLLVANPALSDANFSETVLLIVHHGQDGSLAVALNRPTWVEPAEAFPEIADLASSGNELFFGGPMAPNQLLIVFESDEEFVENSRVVLDGLFVTVDLGVLERLDLPAEGAPRVRLFAGHAAWNPGQLELEVAAGNWRVLQGELSQVFDASPGDLWRRLPLRTDGVTAALVRPPFPAR